MSQPLTGVLGVGFSQAVADHVMKSRLPSGQLSRISARSHDPFPDIGNGRFFPLDRRSKELRCSAWFVQFGSELRLIASRNSRGSGLHWFGTACQRVCGTPMVAGYSANLGGFGFPPYSHHAFDCLFAPGNALGPEALDPQEEAICLR
jgi:hypothetical protein